jgi:RNA polymerase sigma factor (sigma-70 family)
VPRSLSSRPSSRPRRSRSVITAPDRVVEAVWRIESARLIAGLARTVRDVGLAEDLAQDALVAALEQWPVSGVPDNPGAWLTAVARRRYVDGVRRSVTLERKVEVLGRELSEAENPMDELEFDTHVEDDVLRLIFTACHPVLARDARVALTLKLVGGLSTEQVARAFLVPTPTMAARITRAKKALRDAGVPFEVPVGTELGERLTSVLEVVYLIFNEGYSATAGSSWTRRELCDEAMRLGRMLAALAPEEPEVHALVALMELQASRLSARTGADGAMITLLDQNRARWDRLLITHGLGALARAGDLAARSIGTEVVVAAGAYLLQAELAACHARAAVAEDTDWVRIASLYGLLARLTPSPVVELNRAVAVSMADGPAAALPLVDALTSDPALRGYHLLPSVRADLLARLGRSDEARAEFERAAAMTANEREREHLLARAAELG